MIKNSLFDYLTIRSAILALRLIAPLSVLYTPCGFLNLFELPALYNVLLTVCTTAEASFYLFIYLPRRRRLQAPPEHPPPSLSRDQRQRIFEKCLEAPTSVKPYPTGWFIPSDSTPTREEAVNWILWALFSTSREEGRVDLDDPDLRQEMDGYIERIEEVLGHKLPSSCTQAVSDEETGSAWNFLIGERNAKVKSMRITLDPVQMLHRPLLWYLIVCLVDTYTTIWLLSLGFKHYVPRATEYRICFPPRPILSMVSEYAPPGVVVPYWFRSHRSATKLPILFLHGIGIGIYPYIPFIRKIFPDDDGDVGVLLPELLPISMHMTLVSAPPSADKLRSLNIILEDLQLRDNATKPCSDERSSLLPSSSSSSFTSGTGWSSVVLVAHSYGTFVAGWIVRMCVDADMIRQGVNDHEGHTSQENSIKNTNFGLTEKIAHLVLVDPIPILLSDPTVAHNFLYREPGTVCPRKLGSVSLETRSSSVDAHTLSHSPPLPLHTLMQMQPEKPAWYSSASAWQLWYFASRDADVARTLCRTFFWAEGGIWREEVAGFIHGNGNGPGVGALRQDCVVNRRRGRNMAVVLGGMDQIIPSEAIRRYLTREEHWEARWVASASEVSGHVERSEEEEAEVFRSFNDHSDIDNGTRHTIRSSKVCDPDGQHRSDGWVGSEEGSSRARSGEGILEVLFNPKLDHAVIFDEEAYTEPLVALVRRYCAA